MMEPRDPREIEWWFIAPYVHCVECKGNYVMQTYDANDDPEWYQCYECEHIWLADPCLGPIDFCGRCHEGTVMEWSGGHTPEDGWLSPCCGREWRGYGE